MTGLWRWRTLAWLARDTFRQSLANGICWFVLAVSTVSILVCASARIEAPSELAPAKENGDFLPRHDADATDVEKLAQSGVTRSGGVLTLGFGRLQIPLARDATSAVKFLQLALAEGVAGTLGVLVTLLWTAGFLPNFLDARSVAVLLSKPPARWTLLAGKYLGVLAFVAVHALLFVGGTWLALGARTGVWSGRYWLAVPLLVAQFAVFFSFSLVLAVATRNTVACVFGSALFWMICWGMNFGRHTLVARQATEPDAVVSQQFQRVVELGYWALPKPVDFGMLLFDGLQAEESFKKPESLNLVQAQGGFHAGWALLSCGGFAVVMLLVAAREFERLDY